MIIGEAGEAVKAIWGDALSGPGRVYGGGGGGGGSFKMDPQELGVVIGQWEDLLDKLTEDGMTIRRVGDVPVAPGKDSASNGYASSTSDSLLALRDQNDSMRKYVQGYIKKLKEAQTKTVATDQDLSDTFKA